jgi:hypothetical protein
MEENVMTTKERKKRAIGLLAQRWFLITIIAVLTISGIYQFDKFQATKVAGPLIELGWINDEIRYCIGQEATLQGYVDNTEYSNRIRELFQEREENFYHNEDEVIAFVSTSFSLLKILYFLGSIISMLLVTVFPLLILYGFYWNAFYRFKKSWKRIKERQARIKAERLEREKAVRKGKVKDFFDYAQFDGTIYQIK